MINQFADDPKDPIEESPLPEVGTESTIATADGPGGSDPDKPRGPY